MGAACSSMQALASTNQAPEPPTHRPKPQRVQPPTPKDLSTFGFRGEALSSLAALAELSVITRTPTDTAATRLEFDREGKLCGRAACARGVGTTVAIGNLFGPLPVRRQVRGWVASVWFGLVWFVGVSRCVLGVVLWCCSGECSPLADTQTCIALRSSVIQPPPPRPALSQPQELNRNVRREVAKLRLLLQQYAIMCPAAQLFASDQAGRTARCVGWRSNRALQRCLQGPFAVQSCVIHANRAAVSNPVCWSVHSRSSPRAHRTPDAPSMRRTTLVSTGNAGPRLAERVSAVLGSKVAALMVPLEVEVPDSGVKISG